MKHLRNFIAQFDTRDMFLLIGLGLLAYGLTLVWLPGAFIVPGAILLYIALFQAAA